MSRFAGVVIDWFDDKGATLKGLFPTEDTLPEMIKSASIKDKDSLPNEAFALIANDSGHLLRKYACYDAGTTAMSVIYFMEHGDKLPEEVQKTAAAKLTNACCEYGILPPEALTKIAGWNLT
jgi:hypothetical protein